MEFDPTIARRIAKVDRTPMKDDERDNSVEVSNPALGSVKVRGTDIMGVLTLVAVFGIGFYVYAHADSSQKQQAQLVGVLKDLADAQKDANKQSKLLACIVSRPENERKREFESDNSFCQRFSRP